MRVLTRHTGTKFHGTVTRSMFYKGHLYKGHTVGMYDFLLLFDTKTNQKIALSIRDGYSGYLEVSLINQIVCSKYVTTDFSTADGHLSSRGIDITQPNGKAFFPSPSPSSRDAAWIRAGTSGSSTRLFYQMPFHSAMEDLHI